MIDKTRDGHIHTPFCPHGSQDSFEKYIEEALKCGRKEISFTEHFPMPNHVTTKAFQEECALREDLVIPYLQAVKVVKEQYAHQIKINVGFEVDYIEGKEKEIAALLNKYGEEIEDSLLSVHFVKYEDKYYAIDYLPEFKALLEAVGSIEKVYDIYFNTVLKSIKADLGAFKPKRIGHPTLVRIFHKKYPCEYKQNELLEKIIEAVAQEEYEIDYNVAGLRKPYCGETYPSGKLLELILARNIKMIYGTDAHNSKDIKS